MGIRINDTLRILSFAGKSVCIQNLIALHFDEMLINSWEATNDDLHFADLEIRVTPYFKSYHLRKLRKIFDECLPAIYRVKKIKVVRL